ncbi:MAG: hypothetical protein IKR05_06300 [Prevotella sp.]|nr:hypothetical protein [Prevotella sp.]
MNILILAGSPWKRGNADILVEVFASGAIPRRRVDVVSVNDFKISRHQEW